ncbi:MAG: YhfC family glutamic-type intramembrane protease [Eubacteriales bacterium]|nr:YhfC family glutamic-type intramembrane protease [Eubacteriales bacterium]
MEGSSVSWLSMVCMALSGLLAVGTPAVLLIVLAKRKMFSGKALGLGAAGFVIFAMMLEQGLHALVLRIPVFMQNVWVYAVYGALAAGVFEELGRFVLIRLFLKKRTQRSDALCYGIGHGGVEALMLGGLTAVNNLTLSVMANLGLTDVLTQAAQGQGEAVTQAIAQLTQASAPMFLLGGVERMLTLPLQMALTVLVFLGVRLRKPGYVVLAVLAHAAVDFPVALAQRGVISLGWIYGWMVLVSAGSVYALWRSRRWPQAPGADEGCLSPAEKI